MSNLNEGLRQDDLQYLVSNYISVDQYTSKLDDDNITVAFFCNEKEAAEDLLDFLEKIYYIELRDIEISDSLTEDNKYILFVEFERNLNFPKILLDMLDSVNNITHNKDWKFKTFNMEDKMDATIDNLNQYVRLSKYRETFGDIKDDKNEESEESSEKNTKKSSDKEETNESFSPIILNDRGWKRNYRIKGYITEEKLNECILKSSSLNTRDNYEISLFEQRFPDYQVISTDENVFLIKGEKILMLGE